jgi:hypothetical protein
MNTAGGNQYYQYWPFPVNEEDRQRSGIAEKIEFLESIYSDGFEAYQDPKSPTYYVGKSKVRAGSILERGTRDRWSLSLTESIEPRLTALVTNFSVAGTAVRNWLNGYSASEILNDINSYLISSSKSDNVYTIYDPDDEKYWPFSVSEADRQRPEISEKIEFLEKAYSDGFETYQVCRDQEHRYVAKSQSCIGYIEEWGEGNFWNLAMFGNEQRFTAYVVNFRIAGQALINWLNERKISSIIEDINEYLIIPPGFTSSYTLELDESIS